MTPNRISDKTDNQDNSIKKEALDRLLNSDLIPCELAGKTVDEIIYELRVHQYELEIQNEELKKANQEIEISRDQYADLYDFAPVGYITLTSEMMIDDANLTAASMLGVTRQELLHTRFRKFVSPGDHDVWDRSFIQILHSQKKYTGKIRLITSDGSFFFSQFEGIRTTRSDDSIQIRLAILDISIQHNAVLNSDLNSQRVLSLLGLYQHTYLDDTGFLEYVLEESLKVTSSTIGFIGHISDDEQMMVGHAWSKEVMESCSVHTAPLNFPLSTAGVWADSVRLKKPVIINDYEAMRPGGKYLPLGHIPLSRVISVPIMSDDHVVSVIAGANKENPYDEEDEKALTTLAHTAWELFSHRKAEEALLVNEKRLRKAQYIAEFGNLSYDFQSEKVNFSPEVFRILGIDTATWTGSMDDVISYIHPDDQTLFQEAFMLIHKKGGKGDIELRVKKPDETVRWIHIIAEMAFDKAGNQIGIEGIIKDISERKQSEIDRIEALAQITNNLEVLATLNDEIRNPLAIITAAADIERGKYTETILKAVYDIDRIIDQLDRGWIESEKVRNFLKLHYGF